MARLDISQFPRHFDSRQAEERWDARWQSEGTYHYQPGAARGDTFVIDTPPPTVSGSLHIGHVFSYTHTDLLARYQRMRGRRVFYPMGWDDNGLPTERRVQNYFNVRCDPAQPYVADLALEAGYEGPPRRVSRANFIELCLELTAEDEKAFQHLWRRIGLSVDWRQEYSTIDYRSRRLAQWSFLDLYRQGHIYSLEAPTMWDIDFQTAVAQAEVEDRTIPGHFYLLRFKVEGSPQPAIIATTRPELLPACVGITAHPRDPRYQALFGKRAITPLFRVPVPIFPSELADPEKGTGILMVCTFGDATDVRWWSEKKLPLRQVIGRDGRFLPVRYGEPGWESLDVQEANRHYSALAGKTIREAQKTIAELLHPCLISKPKPIQHSVKFFEKGEQPLEFIPTRQWFVRLLDKKDRLIELGQRIEWHPGFMRQRFQSWTENLQLDWCISRQRYFGVPFPIWYPLDVHGQADRDHPVLASMEELPIDPASHPLSGCVPEADVLDTWFTSSLTPEIVTEPCPQLFPADLRPQSHEIIRTWAFYSIVKAWLHFEAVPWRHVAISGWVLDPDRKKMSKSKGNVLVPIDLLDQYGSDAVRYWSANARLGTDTAFDPNILKIGKRLVTKLFNAGKFVITQHSEPAPVTHPLDLAFLGRLRQVVERATSAWEQFEHAAALEEVERFFWRGFTDNYLELVKARARGPQPGSAVATLRITLKTFLRLLAPFLPFITEEIWSWCGEESQSIHRTRWPEPGEFPQADPAIFETAVVCLAAINRRKSESGLSTGRSVARLELACNPATAARLRTALSDVVAAARAEQHELSERAELADDSFLVV